MNRQWFKILRVLLAAQLVYDLFSIIPGSRIAVLKYSGGIEWRKAATLSRLSNWGDVFILTMLHSGMASNHYRKLLSDLAVRFEQTFP